MQSSVLALLCLLARHCTLIGALPAVAVKSDLVDIDMLKDGELSPLQEAYAVAYRQHRQLMRKSLSSEHQPYGQNPGGLQQGHLPEPSGTFHQCEKLGNDCLNCAVGYCTASCKHKANNSVQDCTCCICDQNGAGLNVRDECV
mmetsp:Transcript_78639/g.122728  ORF Transcript_78639/g.122728 Transcript_78639/m.122728 type:complete len:143 (+) Transcript_78639:44-472(+)